MCQFLSFSKLHQHQKNPRFEKKMWLFFFNMIFKTLLLVYWMYLPQPGCNRPSSPPGIPTNKPTHLLLEFWYPRQSAEEMDGDGWWLPFSICTLKIWTKIMFPIENKRFGKMDVSGCRFWANVKMHLIFLVINMVPWMMRSAPEETNWAMRKTRKPSVDSQDFPS